MCIRDSYPAAWTTWNISKDDPTSKQVMIKIYKTRLTGETTTEKPGSINTDQRKIYVATTTEWLEITELQDVYKRQFLKSSTSSDTNQG